VISSEFPPLIGLCMLIAVCILTISTRWAVWEVLITVSTVFSIVGLLSGYFNLAILGLLASRLSGLLENDLLQAVPLYIFFGIQLQSSGIANDIFSLLKRICIRLGLPQQVSILFFSALISPMNGSVAASAGLLKKFLFDDELRQVNPKTISLISASATVGLVVPPSLVLILMGDAMMRAHTEAFNSGLWNPSSQHVMNTADMFHVALIPGLVIFSLWILVTSSIFWVQQPPKNQLQETLTKSVLIRAWIAILFIVTILLGVFKGMIYAVEGAATGCLVMMIYTLWKIRFDFVKWKLILKDTYSFSGSLLSLLIAATTFSLIFRLFETDRWISQWIFQSPSDFTHLTIIFIGIAACAWLMDAFELIFVIVPIVSPGLIILLGSAEQTAELLLLVIQLSYLIPPLGYAVVIASQSTEHIEMKKLIYGLMPYVIILFLVFNLVLLHPQSLVI